MSLINQFTWPELCEQVKSKANISDKGFTEWFAAKQPLGYQFDAITYKRAWNIYKQLHDDYDHFTVVVGKERRGKSKFTYNFVPLVSPGTRLIHVCFTAKQFYTALRVAKPGDTVWADEGALILFSGDSSSRTTKKIIKLCTVIGERNLHVIICIPNFWLLHSYIRLHRIDTLIKIRKRGTFMGYAGEDAIRKIAIGGERTKSFYGIKVPDGSYWPGYWNNLEPEYNDLTWDIYKQFKRQNTDKFLEEAEKDEQRDEAYAEYYNDKIGIGHLKVSTIAERLGQSQENILRLIKTGRIAGRKIGGLYYVKEGDYEAYISGVKL